LALRQAAAVQEEDEPTMYQPPPGEAPRFGGGWARSSFNGGLTPEEERQRLALQEAVRRERIAVDVASRSTNDRTSRDFNGYASPSRTERPGYGDTTLPTSHSGQNVNQRPTVGEYRLRGFAAQGEVRRPRWYCPRCNSSNHGNQTTCRKCSTPLPASQEPPRAPSETASNLTIRRFLGNGSQRVDNSQATTRVDDRPYNPEVASSWQHVRRRGDHSTSQAPNQEGGSGEVQEESESEADRALVEARLAREKQSRAGRFVGFGGSPKSEEARSVFRRIAFNSGSSRVPLESRDDTSIVSKPTAVNNLGEDLSSGQTTGRQDSSIAAPAAGLLSPSKPEPESTPIENTAPEEEIIDQEEGHRQRRRRRADRDALEQVALTKTHDSTPQGPRRDRARRRPRNDYDDAAEEEELRFERKRQRKREKIAQRAAAPPVPIYLPEFISISNLATALKIKTEDFVYTMRSMGFEETSNDHVLDAETAGLIAVEYNYDPIIDRSQSKDLQARPPAEDKSVLPQRPPVVTIMGHVDHGKTTLLDWLRKSSVAASEHGGITQHIGAFSVPMPSGRLITFLDTPGHAAFLSMRQRGANVTDIVILVVAADDSVKPQTIEAIKHAKAAKVPIIVAVNKIDKEEANVEKVKQDLARHGVDVEDFGGDTQIVCVSGKTGQGMEELEEAAVALADVLDMRAETDGPAEGWVLEATTKKAGRVATVLVRRGTMRPGDVIVAGSTWARIRSLRNEAGVQTAAAGPGTPVEIDGWKEQPAAGEEVLQAPDEHRAKSVVDLRLERGERSKMAVDMEAVNESRRIDQEKREREEQVAEGEKLEAPEQQPGVKEVYFIVKGDVSGSVEAVLNSVSALGNEEVRPHILRSGVGPVAEFDVEHAAVAKGHIISFNTPIEPNIARVAGAAGVLILDENIIYRLVDDVKAKLSEQLTPLTTQRVVGEADIAKVFEINVKGKTNMPIAGCKIRNGVVHRNSKVKVLREKNVIYEGKDPIKLPPH